MKPRKIADVIREASVDLHLRPGEFRLLCSLLFRADNFWVRRVTVPDLCQELGRCERTLTEWLNGLVSAGYIERKILRGNLPAAYKLICLEPATTANPSGSKSAPQKTAPPSRDGAVESLGLSLSLQKGLDPTNKTKEHTPLSDADSCAPLTHFSAINQLLEKRVIRRQPWYSVFTDPPAWLTDIEMLLASRYLINSENANPHTPEFAEVLSDFIREGNLDRSDVRASLQKGIEQRLHTSRNTQTCEVAELESELFEYYCSEGWADDVI